MRVVPNGMSASIAAVVMVSLLASPVVSADADVVLALVAAIRDDDNLKLEALLNDGYDPQNDLEYDSPPIVWAVERQNAKAVQLLLAAGADPNGGFTSITGFTPIFVACESGDAIVITLLLDAGADVNRTGPQGTPSLAACAAHAPLALVKRMVEISGANVRASDWRGQTPLMWAASTDRSDVVQYLLSSGASLDRVTATGFTALFFAIKSKGLAAVKALVAAGADADHRGPEGTSALQLAFYQENFAAAKLLLPYSMNDVQRLDRNGNQPLHVAAAAGDVELVRDLIAAGADPNALTGLSRVSWRFETNFKTGDFEYPKMSPLLLAARAGQAQVMTELVEAGADPTFTTIAGDDVLLTAASSASPAALSAALAIGRDVDFRNERGQTALHLVIKKADKLQMTNMASILLEHAARSDIADKTGVTAGDLALDPNFHSRTKIFALFNTQEI
jgi:ankyrin repeat protein